MPDHRSVRSRLRRRLVSVPGLFVAALAITLTVPIWVPAAVLVDVTRGRFRLPIARLLAFGVCWTWIEAIGVLRAFGHWVTGRARDERANYGLMRWWADALVGGLRATIGIDPRVEHVEALVGGDAIVLARHASLADSLLSAWAIRGRADVWPRYVLKRELLLDPCLDVVGLRVPNHFLDRTSGDAAELEALRALADGVGPGVVAVIFPEGTRSNDRKRARALERIAERDPARAERLANLRRLLPPRPAGTRALVEGAPGADVVFAWHTGFDGLDSFGGILARLAEPLPPVRFVLRRVPRAEVPSGEAFDRWLDDQWSRMDAEVDAALTERGERDRRSDPT
jgi:1-acyl-sn-glycerol-3-phosphate acyltransferase